MRFPLRWLDNLLRLVGLRLDVDTETILPPFDAKVGKQKAILKNIYLAIRRRNALVRGAASEEVAGR